MVFGSRLATVKIYMKRVLLKSYSKAVFLSFLLSCVYAVDTLAQNGVREERFGDIQVTHFAVPGRRKKVRVRLSSENSYVLSEDGRILRTVTHDGGLGAIDSHTVFVLPTDFQGQRERDKEDQRNRNEDDMITFNVAGNAQLRVDPSQGRVVTQDSTRDIREDDGAASFRINTDATAFQIIMGTERNYESRNGRSTIRYLGRECPNISNRMLFHYERGKEVRRKSISEILAAISHRCSDLIPENVQFEMRQAAGEYVPDQSQVQFRSQKAL